MNKDEMVLDNVKEVEKSCTNFIKEYSEEKEPEKLAQGLSSVMRSLRSLMLIIEKDEERNGPLDMMLCDFRVKCGGGDHDHLHLLVFNSRGEFNDVEMRELGPVVVPAKMERTTLSDALRNNANPETIIKQVQERMYKLVASAQSTQFAGPIARA